MKQDETSRGQKERLLIALLAGKTLDEAASDAGVSRATAWRWRQGPKFKSRLEQARDEVLRAGLDRVVAGVAQAVATLTRNLNCGTPAAENAAAGKLLDTALKFKEQLELVGRLDALEARMEMLPEYTS